MSSSDQPKHFFSVSLAENIPALVESVPTINRLYAPTTYTIICPGAQVDRFIAGLAARCANVKIFAEERLLSYARFKEIFDTEVLPQLPADVTAASASRLPWYYQQVLKIIYALIFEHLVADASYPVVMWDADTIPLRWLDFIDPVGNSTLYGSLLEAHAEYFQTLSVLYGVEICLAKGYTVQFFSASRQEAQGLRGFIQARYPCHAQQPFAEHVAYFVLQSVYAAHGSLAGSRFSEQELFGWSNFLASGNCQVPILHFRPWQLSGQLTEPQKRLLAWLGFSHLTYEKLDGLGRSRQPWGAFLRLALSQLRHQLWRLLVSHLNDLRGRVPPAHGNGCKRREAR